jgi:hypothetical protein
MRVSPGDTGRSLVVELTEGPARRARPDRVERADFDEMLGPMPLGAVPAAGLVPIEAARAGDAQVLAARFPGRPGVPVVDLDGLAGLPSVVSVVASTEVRARRLLPEVRELLLLERAPVPDAETLRCVPGLRTLFAMSPLPGRTLSIESLPASELRDLAVRRACLDGLAPLGQLTGLRRLIVSPCLPGDSVGSVGALTELVRLEVGGPRVGGWRALRACVALEQALLNGLAMPDLRAYAGWSRLRSLTITRPGLRSLAGVEALGSLEHLRLVMMGIDDLGPLRGRPGLRSLELVGMRGVHDLSALGSLPGLRRLEVARAGIEERDIVHVDSLRPLAGAVGLEELVLDAAVVDDGDLSPLAGLPGLRRVAVFGDLGAEVDRLRRARPDVAVELLGGPAGAPGEPVGVVAIHPPGPGIEDWWIRENLAATLGVETNYDAERLLLGELADAALRRRLTFDTESGAVSVAARDERDIRAVAAAINRLATS